MIEGRVTSDGVPKIVVEIEGHQWTAVIDTGFNRYLELPVELKTELNAVYFGQVVSALAGGQELEAEAYYVEFPWDGDHVLAEVTFVDGDEILVGTSMMSRQRLTVDFPAKTLRIERTTS